MKPLLLLLSLSVAANAILFFSRPKPQNTSAPATPAAVEKSSASPSLNSQPSTLNSSAAFSVPTGPHAPFWEKLRTGDASTVAALRAAGWPEDAIRSVAAALIGDAYQSRFDALLSSRNSQEYWRPDSFYNRSTPEQRKAANELSRELRTRLKSLLGEDYLPEQTWQDPRFARFTPAQAEALRMIDEDYNVLTMEIRGNPTAGRTILLPEDREKLLYLEKEKAADMAKVLSPSEFLEYELRQSTAASYLRSNLAGLRPTEEEFRALFPHQKAMLEKMGISSGAPSTNDRAVREQAQREMDAAAKTVLTPERYEDYVRAKDYDYGRLVVLAERLQLPPENATAAYEVKADIEKRLRALRPSGPDAQKTLAASRTELAAEAEKRLVAALGQRGYEAYKTNGAFWLNNLTPPSPSAR
ncbi:hypothetical protein [Nibricoccus aquaticus]|nr:hypothetical protein [Nibricoccus aquaticus]